MCVCAFKYRCVNWCGCGVSVSTDSPTTRVVQPGCKKQPGCKIFAAWLQNAAKKPNIEGEIFDVGNGKEISVKDIVELTCDITNTNLKIKWSIENQSRSKKDIDKQPANIQKTKKLNWKPNISIKKGLLKTFDWYKEHIDLYKNFRLISDFD